MYQTQAQRLNAVAYVMANKEQLKIDWILSDMDIRLTIAYLVGGRDTAITAYRSQYLNDKCPKKLAVEYVDSMLDYGTMRLGISYRETLDNLR